MFFLESWILLSPLAFDWRFLFPVVGVAVVVVVAGVAAAAAAADDDVVVVSFIIICDAC